MTSRSGEGAGMTSRSGEGAGMTSRSGEGVVMAGHCLRFGSVRQFQRGYSDKTPKLRIFQQCTI